MKGGVTMNKRQAKKTWKRQWVCPIKPINDYHAARVAMREYHETTVSLDLNMVRDFQNTRPRNWTKAKEQMGGRWYLVPERRTRSFSQDDWNCIR